MTDKLGEELILMLNGSPGKKGVTTTILKIIADESISAGATVERVVSRCTAPLYFCCLLLIFVSLDGCSTIRILSKSEDDSIREGQQTIVLLRVTGTVGDQPVEMLKRFGLTLASIDKNEAPHAIIFPSTPSSEKRREGWLYQLLGTGETYYFSPFYAVNMATDIISTNLPYATVYLPLKPDLRFHLPSNKQIVYIGSFSFTCDGKINIFGIPQIKSCSELIITDEAAAAQIVARDSFPQYGLPTTELMEPWLSPAPDARQYSPLGIASTSVEGIVSPGWYEHSLKKSIGVGLSAMEFAGGKLFAVLYLPFYLPVGTVMGVVGGAHSTSKWNPCIERLGQELQAADPTTQLRNKLLVGLQNRGVDSIAQIPVGREMTAKSLQMGLKAILQADVQQVTLTECSEGWTFSLDAYVRVRLWETATGKYLYDRVFVNSSKNLFPYQSPIENSKCRKIEEYCSEGGMSIMREELSKAIGASVLKCLGDLAP